MGVGLGWGFGAALGAEYSTAKPRFVQAERASFFSKEDKRKAAGGGGGWWWGGRGKAAAEA